MATSPAKPRRAGRPATGRQMVHVALRLPADVLPALDREAEARGHTRSAMARWIVMQWLKEASKNAGRAD